MNGTKISLLFLSLGMWVYAYASEYNSPDIKLKVASTDKQEVKTQEFDSGNKVENPAPSVDRKIASEYEDDSKPVGDDDEGDDDLYKNKQPKPWIINSKSNIKY